MYNCPHCEALQQSARDNKTTIAALASATNGKLDRVHERIDKLMGLAITTLATTAVALGLAIFKWAVTK
jgi:hypothetical protein